MLQRSNLSSVFICSSQRQFAFPEAFSKSGFWQNQGQSDIETALFVGFEIAEPPVRQGLFQSRTARMLHQM